MDEFQQKTLDWISTEIDKINDESVTIGEMLLEENNKESIKILDDKLGELEKKLDSLNQKFIFEKENFYK
jgi:chaperonin cofactor prefoldin